MTYAGAYAYRFSGYAMKKRNQHHLVGVGALKIRADSTITGRHRAALLPLVGSNPTVQKGLYKIGGTLKEIGEQDLEADMMFTRLPWDATDDTFEQKIRGVFSLVPAGDPGRFWMISTYTYNETEKEVAEEVVSGEAIRIA